MSGTRRQAGSLGPYVAGYRAWLFGRGYTDGTARNQLKELGQLGRWLSIEGLAPAHLDEARVAAFLCARQEAGYRRVPGMRGMVPLLSYLRDAGVIASRGPAPLSALGELLGRYRWWMVQDRGLAASTVLRYDNTARRFLREQAYAGDVFAPRALSGIDVTSFLLRECARVSVGSAKGRVAELRSVLKFLYLQDITPLPLWTAVPPVAGWRDTTLVPTMATCDVARLLEGCDRSYPTGVRDFAIITLIARLGLRSIEVARLQLGDIDWRAGELVVRGKARRQDRLPLPAEVGQALAAYLGGARRPDDTRALFLTCRAPRGPIRADLVGDVVERACHRAKLPVVGPHRLRHALAAELLRRGAALSAIGQVLGHRDLATTALYAKVDLGALRDVAQPWPGAQR